MRRQRIEQAAPRDVSPKLMIGIALLPGIFVWFLLRKGHTPLARAVGFGWAGLLLLLSVTRPLYLSEPASSSASAAQQPHREELSTEPPALTESEAQAITQRAELSNAAKELKTLYSELNQFRRDPEFLRVGFGLCCRYNDWKRRVEELDRTSGPEILQQHKISPGDLLQLGLEYMQNDGRSTRLSESISARLDFALAPTVPKATGGRAIEEGWWCRDIETWFEFMRMSEEGDFAKADQLMSEPACPHVLPNTTTGPELERRYYTFPDGKTRAGFARVKLNSGPEVWAPLDAIEFR